MHARGVRVMTALPVTTCDIEAAWACSVHHEAMKGQGFMFSTEAQAWPAWAGLALFLQVVNHNEHCSPTCRYDSKYDLAFG